MAIRLLVVGRDGNGKSSTANSILDLKCFNPSLNHDSSTKVDCKEANSVIDGQEVTLMKISGLEYPNVDNSEDFESNFVKIEEAVKGSQYGFCAVVIVVKYGLRYTRQEQEAVMMIKSTFGSTVVNKYGVIVVSNGDNFAADMEEDGQTFEGWCRSQTGEFRALLDECESRYVLFNNRTQDDKTLKDQREKLFTTVANIQSKVGPYTLNDYEEAANSRTHILVASTLPRFKRETTNVLIEIRNILNQISQSEPSLSVLKETLENLLAKLKDHKHYLQTEDKNTEILQSLFLELSIAERTIMIKLQIADQYLSYELDEGWEIMDEDEALPASNLYPRLADEFGNDTLDSETSGETVDYIRGDTEKDVNTGTIWAAFLYLKRWINILIFNQQNCPEDRSEIQNSGTNWPI